MVSDNYVLTIDKKHKELPRYSISREFVFNLTESNGNSLSVNSYITYVFPEQADHSHCEVFSCIDTAGSLNERIVDRLLS